MVTERQFVGASLPISPGCSALRCHYLKGGVMLNDKQKLEILMLHRKGYGSFMSRKRRLWWLVRGQKHGMADTFKSYCHISIQRILAKQEEEQRRIGEWNT